MAPQPTERELDLARRLEALEMQAARPAFSGGGLLSTIVNGVISQVPIALVRTAVIVFIAWHGWVYFNSWQQLSAETQKLEAQAAALAADADAKGLIIDGDTLQAQKMLIEFAALQTDIQKVKAEADKTQAEANAQNQRINDVRLSVLQKRAEVEKAEASVQNKIAGIKAALRIVISLTDGDTQNPLIKWVQILDLMQGAATGVMFDSMSNKK